MLKYSTLLLGASTLAASVIAFRTDAAEVQQLPSQLLGDWCFHQTNDGHGKDPGFDDKYERRIPCDNGRLTVDGRSYSSGWKDDDPSQVCDFRTIEEVVRGRIYRVRAICMDVEFKWEEWTAIKFIPGRKQFIELRYTRTTEKKLIGESK